MALNDTTIRNAKLKDKAYKLGDSGGLFLLVQPSRGKLWRIKYRLGGREKKLGLGTYPDVSLGDARKRKDEARALVAASKDPSREKQQAKHRAVVAAGNNFSDVGREYLDKRIREGMALRKIEKAEFHLSRLILTLGRMTIMVSPAPPTRGGSSTPGRRGSRTSASITTRPACTPPPSAGSSRPIPSGIRIR